MSIGAPTLRLSTEYNAALDHAIASGWLWLRESGTYVKFTPAGAELLA